MINYSTIPQFLTPVFISQDGIIISFANIAVCFAFLAQSISNLVVILKEKRKKVVKMEKKRIKGWLKSGEFLTTN